MYGINIKINPDKSWCSLIPVTIGRGSDALFILHGIPIGWVAKLYVTRSDAPTPVYFTATLDANGVLSVYAAGANFVGVGEHRYEISITEPDTGRTYWCGSGVLRVVSAISESVNPGLGDTLETYIRNPVTGLYHKVTAEINDDGDISSVVDSTGVTLA